MRADLSRHFGSLTPEERFRLYVKARARGDEQEARRLVDSCPRVTWTGPEATFRGRLMALYDGVGQIVVPNLKVRLIVLHHSRTVLAVMRDGLELSDGSWEEGTVFGLRWAAKTVPAAQRKKLLKLANGMEAREEEAEEVGPDPVWEDVLSKSRIGQEVRGAATELRAVWDAFGAFCEEELDLPAEEVLRAFCPEPDATRLLEAVLKETAEAAVDAEEMADWQRIFRASWRSRALGEREADEELKAMIAEEEPGQETPAAEAVAEGEER